MEGFPRLKTRNHGTFMVYEGTTAIGVVVVLAVVVTEGTTTMVLEDRRLAFEPSMASDDEEG